MDNDLNAGIKKRAIGKKFLKAILWFFFVTMLLGVSLSALLFIYEDEVKSAIISELNKNLKAEVKIDPKNIDLTIIETFPDCSIQFKNVLILEALPIKQKDTLVFAQQLNLLFNILDIWDKKYAIQKIKLKDGVLKPKILKDGKNNYTIWETLQESKQNNEALNFNLELLALDHCRLLYVDQQLSFRALLEIKKFDFKGDFKKDDFRMGAEGNVLINKISSGKNVFFNEKECKMSATLNVSKNKYTISKAQFSIAQLRMDLNGSFTYQDSLSNLNFVYSAPDLDIAAALSLMPPMYKDKTKDYKSTGNFYANGKFFYQSQKDFLLEGNFGIKKGSITYQPKATTISQVNVEGFLKYGTATSLLKIKSIYLKLYDDELNATAVVKNFSDPYLKFSAQSNINLSNLQAFWPIDTLTKLRGNLKIKADVEGLLRDLRKQTFSSNVKINVNASVLNLEAQFKNDAQVFTIESGSLAALDRELEVQNLKFKRGSSDLLLNGKVPGFFNYLSDASAPLVIRGNLFSNYIKLEDFMVKYEASGGESNLIPPNISFKLNAKIQKFSYAQFSANSIAGEIEVKNQKAVISDMILSTMGGTARIDAFSDNVNHNLNVVLQSKLTGINVSHLFTAFNNFGQNTLEDKNIKGFLSADIDFSGTWNNQLEVDLNSIRATCELNIDRGELIDFKPLVSLSKFVDVEDLQHIKFSTLRSDVIIRDKTITFPKTTLINTALNIVFSGTHTFDNIIDYHIQLVISELLAKRRKADDEFGPVEEDKEKRRNAFIFMTGPLDNPKKGFDRKGQKEKIKEDWKQEKKNVKRIFKEEFGLKKNEKPVEEKKSEQKFELEKPDNNQPKKTLEPKKKPVEEDF